MVQYDYFNSKRYKCRFLSNEYAFVLETKSIFEILDVLSLFKFDEIFINSFVSYPSISDMVKVTIALSQKNKAKVIVPIHDFFPICPSYTLLNEKMVYCGVPSDHSVCDKCLAYSRGEFKTFETETNIEIWRSTWQKLLDSAEEILCFSNSSKEIFAKAYPQYIDKVIIKPHDISSRYVKIYDSSKKQNKQVIGVLGGINEAKGAKVVKNLVEYIQTNNLNAKVVLIGQISNAIEESEYFHCTGRYKLQELPQITRRECITEFFIPSIWPETFSYTTDEIMQLGYPLTVFDLGAPAERVKDYELGRVITLNEWIHIVK